MVVNSNTSACRHGGVSSDDLSSHPFAPPYEDDLPRSVNPSAEDPRLWYSRIALFFILFSPSFLLLLLLLFSFFFSFSSGWLVTEHRDQVGGAWNSLATACFLIRHQKPKPGSGFSSPHRIDCISVFKFLARALLHDTLRRQRGDWQDDGMTTRAAWHQDCGAQRSSTMTRVQDLNEGITTSCSAVTMTSTQGHFLAFRNRRGGWYARHS